ncbi:ABC transporter permease subunit [Weissella confusa]|uniref:ABC transporter permease subunit n=1 Tax=Weissella confusa TaxID=1583 RepID=A0A923NCQ0_WEICO|nr:ABC transporter permease subunit [Weissella confusa]
MLALYCSEALQAVPAGQTEAARSLGFTKMQTMRFMVLPQAIKNILPALGNEFVTVIKEGSVVSVIGVGELTFQTSFSSIKPLKWLAVAYIEAVRGVPLLIQVFIVYFGTQVIGLDVSSFMAGAIAMFLNSAAYVAEIIRSGDILEKHVIGDPLEKWKNDAIALMNHKESFFEKYAPYFAKGTLYTVGLAVIGVFFGIILGVLLALMKLKKVNDAVTQLTQGKVDGVVVPDTTADSYMDQSNQFAVAKATLPGETNGSSVVMAKNATVLQSKVDTATPEREQEVAFSEPYFVDKNVVMTLKKNANKLANLNDLKKATLAAQISSIQEDAAKQVGAKKVVS